MTDKDYDTILEFKDVGGSALVPHNQNAITLTEQNKGRVMAFKEVTARDVSKHRAYFGLLKFIWLHLTPQFQEVVPQKHFYQWLKHAQGRYKILYTFKTDKTAFIEYESISFGRMSNARFMEYVKGQLPFIYNEVIRPLYSDELAEITIELIENEWEDYLNTL